MLISEEVYTALDDRFDLVKMPAELIKGKEQPIVTYFVKGFAKTLSRTPKSLADSTSRESLTLDPRTSLLRPNYIP